MPVNRKCCRPSSGATTVKVLIKTIFSITAHYLATSPGKPITWLRCIWVNHTLACTRNLKTNFTKYHESYPYANITLSYSELGIGRTIIFTQLTAFIISCVGSRVFAWKNEYKLQILYYYIFRIMKSNYIFTIILSAIVLFETRVAIKMSKAIASQARMHGNWEKRIKA